MSPNVEIVRISGERRSALGERFDARYQAIDLFFELGSIPGTSRLVIGDCIH